MKKALALHPAYMPWRFYTVMAVCLLLAVALLLRLSLLQILPEEQGFLEKQGDRRSLRTLPIAASRGAITDRNGEPLAVSTPVVSLWIDPRKVDWSESELKQVAKLLGKSEKKFTKRFNFYKEGKKGFMYLRRHLSPSDAESLLAVPGVQKEVEYRRFYPAAEVAAHVVGITDSDDQGQEGMELAYDDWLSGEPGRKQVLKNLKGEVVRDLKLIKAAEPGNSLALSIDMRLQYMAYRALKQAVQTHQAKSGSVVVLDVATGEILAMVNQPSFNPNSRADLTSAALRNRAAVDVFEPGSTMKPLTVMTALESGRYTPGTIINTSPGYIRVQGKTWVDPVNYGVINLTKVLTKSSQVGVTKIAMDLELDDIRDMYQRLGIGRLPGTGFPGESVGVLPMRKRWSDIERVTFAFGYGMSLSALQLAQAYSVLANDGVSMPVSLLRVAQATPGEQVLQKKLTKQLRSMLQTVTEKGGTGTRASIAGYKVAGKTGTVHKASGGGYSSDRYRSLFAGFAPVNDPRIAVVVVVEEPKAGGYFGGEVAAPVFSSVAAGAMRVLEVPPTESASRVAGKVTKRKPLS